MLVCTSDLPYQFKRITCGGRVLRYESPRIALIRRCAEFEQSAWRCQWLCSRLRLFFFLFSSFITLLFAVWIMFCCRSHRSVHCAIFVRFVAVNIYFVFFATYKSFVQYAKDLHGIGWLASPHHHSPPTARHPNNGYRSHAAHTVDWLDYIVVTCIGHTTYVCCITSGKLLIRMENGMRSKVQSGRRHSLHSTIKINGDTRTNEKWEKVLSATRAGFFPFAYLPTILGPYSNYCAIFWWACVMSADFAGGIQQVQCSPKQENLQQKRIGERRQNCKPFLNSLVLRVKVGKSLALQGGAAAEKELSCIVGFSYFIHFEEIAGNPPKRTDSTLTHTHTHTELFWRAKDIFLIWANFVSRLLRLCKEMKCAHNKRLGRTVAHYGRRWKCDCQFKRHHFEWFASHSAACQVCRNDFSRYVRWTMRALDTMWINDASLPVDFESDSCQR